MSKELWNWLEVSDEQRHENWERQSLTLLPSAQLQVLTSEPIEGPDSWPYLYVRVSKEPAEPAIKVIEWLKNRGIGLVIDHKEGQDYPDLVLSWGQVWWLSHRGLWPAVEASEPNSQKQVIEWSSMHTIGQAHPDIWPPWARGILREFLSQQGVPQGKVLAYSRTGEDLELAFSLESLGLPPESEHQGILEAISWFLPPHFTLALLSEKDAPPFEPI